MLLKLVNSSSKRPSHSKMRLIWNVLFYCINYCGRWPYRWMLHLIENHNFDFQTTAPRSLLGSRLLVRRWWSSHLHHLRHHPWRKVSFLSTSFLFCIFLIEFLGDGCSFLDIVGEFQPSSKFPIQTILNPNALFVCPKIQLNKVKGILISMRY